MVTGDIKAEIVQDDDRAPRRFALFENEQLVEYFETDSQTDIHIGAIIAGRIARIFPAQRRAECQLPNGALASFRLGAKPYPKAGDIKVITLTAEPRQHKPWQAEQGISRAGRYIILHHGQEGVRSSHKAKSGKAGQIGQVVQAEIADKIAASIKDRLPKGWGAVIRRQLFDSLDAHDGHDGFDEISSLITSEMTALLAPLSEAVVTGHSSAIAPQILYHGDDMALACRLAANAPPASVVNKEAVFWDDIADEMDRLYSRQVTLDNGVILTIEKTQALTAIDIDSGTSQLGPKEIARHIAKPIMRLIRFARLSGVVLVDMPRLPFAEQEAVLAALRSEARRDRRSPDILGFSRAGLIEIVIRHQYAPLRAGK